MILTEEYLLRKGFKKHGQEVPNYQRGWLKIMVDHWKEFFTIINSRKRLTFKTEDDLEVFWYSVEKEEL